MANWIQGMHMNNGALTRQAQERGETVSEMIEHPPAGADATTKRRIALAKTLRKLAHHLHGKKKK